MKNFFDLFFGTEKNSPSSPEPKGFRNTVVPEKSAVPANVYRPRMIRCGKDNDIIGTDLTENEAISLGFYFKRKTGAAKITKYCGKEEKVVVPRSIGGRKVNEIAARAFENSHIGEIILPQTIYRIGHHAFAGSRVGKINFPENIGIIGEYAFHGCKELKYVILPKCCHIEQYAFAESGIDGFAQLYTDDQSMNFASWDGTMFADTPLYRRTAVILASPEKYYTQYILLIGGLAENDAVHLPALPPDDFDLRYISMNPHSVISPCTLDLTGCKQLCSFTDIISYKTFGDEIIGRCFSENGEHRKLVNMILPQGKSPDLPHFVNVICPDGKPCISAGKQERTISVKTSLPPYSVGGTNASRLTANCDNTVFIYKHAFDEPSLEELTINAKSINTDDEIFTPRCTSLRSVKFTEISPEKERKVKIKYIPPAELVGDELHAAFLKTLADMNNDILSDIKISDNMLYNDELAYYENANNSQIKKHIIRVNQRQKIFTLIDFLRSTYRRLPPGHEENDPYWRYHCYLFCNHGRYPLHVCENVKDKYPGYFEFITKYYYYNVYKDKFISPYA